MMKLAAVGIVLLVFGSILLRAAINGIATGIMRPARWSWIIHRKKNPITLWISIFSHALPATLMIIGGVWALFHR